MNLFGSGRWRSLRSLRIRFLISSRGVVSHEPQEWVYIARLLTAITANGLEEIILHMISIHEKNQSILNWDVTPLDSALARFPSLKRVVLDSWKSHISLPGLDVLADIRGHLKSIDDRGILHITEAATL